MSQDDGEEFGIPETDRWAYVRLDDAKVNLAPKASKARWLRLEQVELGNKTDEYPNGDKVAAIATWEPPVPAADADPAQLNEALDVIATPPADWLYSPTRRGKENNRWAGQVLVDLLHYTDKQAATLVTAWLRSGLLYREQFRDEHRNTRTGVRVDNSRRPTMS